jgi:cytochrome P450
MINDYPITDLIDEYFGFYLAGVATLSQFITMCTYNLLKHQKHKTSVLEELQIGAKPRVLEGVVYETLRFHSPAPLLFDRMAIEDHKLGEFNIKKGTLVTPGFMIRNFDPDVFHNEESFNPDRWNQYTKFGRSFIPFSFGKRKCLGENLAIDLSKYTVGKLLSCFDYNLKNSDYNLIMIPRFLYEPVEEIRYKMSIR